MAARAARTERPVADWWATYFDAGYLREYAPLFGETEARAQVGRLLELLALPAGARVLDLACGQGRHARLLAEAGYAVAGLDFSAPLLHLARDAARSAGLPTRPSVRSGGGALSYRHGDMRRLPAAWGGRFDGVVNLFTSFGFFEDSADDAAVIRGVARVLRPGGRFLWHGGSRDGVLAAFVARDAWEGDGGLTVEQHRDFDPATGFLTIRSTWTRGRRVERRVHRIRLYTADRLADLFRDAGLEVEGVFDDFTDAPLSRRSGEMLLVARAPD